jgi:GNAT superfamily N-acetyltransferase
MTNYRIDIVDWSREPALLNEIVSLQRGAFADQNGPITAASIQTADYYSWKYEGPHGFARVALARDASDLVAMVAAVPIILGDGVETRRFWQLCDIATRPDHRRRGLFGTCVETLAQALAGEPIFCLPNKRSRAGLAAARFQLIANLDLWIRPTRPSWLPTWTGPTQTKSPRRTFRHTYTPETFAWRFKNRPGNPYRVFESIYASGKHSLAATYALQKHFISLVVLMSFEPAECETISHALNRFVAAARSDGALALLYLTTDWRGVVHEGFVRVPNSFVPRGFPVVTRGLNDATLGLTAGEWDVL